LTRKRLEWDESEDEEEEDEQIRGKTVIHARSWSTGATARDVIDPIRARVCGGRICQNI
jgi:hypothetical protein